MYIEKYWGDFIGGSDDSLNLVAFLEDVKKEEITLDEIFIKIGLAKQNGKFRCTKESLEFSHSIGVVMDFHFAIDLITDLAAILLECKVSGSVDLHELFDSEDVASRNIRVTATKEEYEIIEDALTDFTKDPTAYDLYEMIGDDIFDMAAVAAELLKELRQTGALSPKSSS